MTWELHECAYAMTAAAKHFRAAIEELDDVCERAPQSVRERIQALPDIELAVDAWCDFAAKLEAEAGSQPAGEFEAAIDREHARKGLTAPGPTRERAA